MDEAHGGEGGVAARAEATEAHEANSAGVSDQPPAAEAPRPFNWVDDQVAANRHSAQVVLGAVLRAAAAGLHGKVYGAMLDYNSLQAMMGFNLLRLRLFVPMDETVEYHDELLVRPLPPSNPVRGGGGA